jgi:8-oxo-dGTP diphosphatase
MNIPRVGVGVLVLKDGKVLLSKRKADHGKGTWNLPGGHLEYGESPEECAIRESLEETGIRIKNVRFSTITNDLFKDGKHYITLYMTAEWESGEPRIKEPDKAETWEWFDWDDLPRPLFMPLTTLKKQGFRPK